MSEPVEWLPFPPKRPRGSRPPGWGDEAEAIITQVRDEVEIARDDAHSVDMRLAAIEVGGTGTMPSDEALAALMAGSTATRAVIENLIGNYEDESIDLFDRMSVRPGADRRSAIDTLIKSLKAAGVWSRMEGLYVLAAHSSQAALLNWCDATGNNDLTAVNSPTFTADTGYQGNGTTSHLRGPLRTHAKALANDIHLGVWASNITPATGADDIAFDLSTGTDYRINAHNTTGNAVYRMGASSTRSAGSAAPGLVVGQRSSSASQEVFTSGAQFATYADASANSDPLGTAQLTILRYATSYSPRTISFACYGAALTGAQQAALYNALLAYMQAVGVAA